VDGGAAAHRCADEIVAEVVERRIRPWAVARDGEGTHGDPRLSVLALTAGAPAVSIGLDGQDPAPDRTAALRRVPRRAAHVQPGGAVVGAALMAVQTVGKGLAATAVAVRDVSGPMGLAAFGAVVGGARYAWTLPIGRLSFSLLAPSPAAVPMRVATWMLLPPGTAAGTWTAVVLAVAGTAVHAVAGPRRWSGRNRRPCSLRLAPSRGPAKGSGVRGGHSARSGPARVGGARGPARTRPGGRWPYEHGVGRGA
jgi:hypothetical protein